MKIKEYAHCAAFLALCFFAVLSFLVLAGDEDPATQMSLGRWLTIKIASIAVFVVCVYGVKRLYRGQTLTR